MTNAWITSLQPFLQQTAEAVATVLQFDVTIADRHLTRVAGTGRYLTLIGHEVPSSSSFAEVIRTGKPYLIVDPKMILFVYAAKRVSTAMKPVM